MRVLIIGGAGLIGWAVGRDLALAGHGVTALTRTATVPLAAHVARRLGDRDEPGVLGGIAREGWDAVVDLVCFSPAQAERSIAAFRGNTLRYVMCSTVDVYRKDAVALPIAETAPRNPSPRFPYAFGKARSEEVLENAAERGLFDLTVVRPAATY
ncbi:NAD-dependent epimerase/dehydratase family protein [Galbitalea sp. SE-J8]|uniref:NAD-dependent epimerase/dehydratase family protein n=1 Tax=Galbitalea sp. SE-J8 TaxID=3054952 RepID=UPI00259CB8A0|nr:NAD-dependent epimerase/dehydratase family protein [Galbitalea sp. SE-J8]MDM4761545.1 NAD-dependent epimerase/dehydratase family protein [Galbitalea sp. SE-J8]